MFSIWEKESFFSPRDVVIAGSGFTGLWSAFYIKKKNPELKVTIVESGLIPAGASSRNAGFACFGSLSEVVSDTHKMGTEKMLELLEMRYKGLGLIQKYFKDNQIDFDLCGGYELYEAGRDNAGEEIFRNMEYINSLLKPVTGTAKTYISANEKISEFGFANTGILIKNKLEGYLHPGKLLSCLLQKVQGLGVQVMNQVAIKNYERNGEGFKIHTNLDFPLSARCLLLCTNAFTKAILPEADIIPVRGQVLVSSPVTGLPFKGTFHSEEGYYYFRNLGNRVLLGGARHKNFDAENSSELIVTDFIQRELERYLADVVLPTFKGQYNIENRWAGIMAMGSDKLPIIKEVEPGIFCAVRMSGMGVALAPVAGKKAARMVVGSF